MRYNILYHSRNYVDSYLLQCEAQLTKNIKNLFGSDTWLHACSISYIFWVHLMTDLQSQNFATDEYMYNHVTAG